LKHSSQIIGEVWLEKY